MQPRNTRTFLRSIIVSIGGTLPIQRLVRLFWWLGYEESRQWGKGKVIELIKGRDIVVRGVKLQTKGHYIEDLWHLCVRLTNRKKEVIQRSVSKVELGNACERRIVMASARKATERIQQSAEDEVVTWPCGWRWNFCDKCKYLLVLTLLKLILLIWRRVGWLKYAWLQIIYICIHKRGKWGQ